MSEIKFKTFLEALKLVHSYSKKSKKYLSDKRLTIAEKKILQCWFDLKNCEHQKILESLKTVNTEDDLINSQKHLILGLTYNNMGNPKAASAHLEVANSFLEKYPLTDHQFICAYNHFIISFNLNHDQKMKQNLRLMEKLSGKGINDRQKICYEQSKFNYFTFRGYYDEASKVLAYLEENRSLMAEAVIMAHHIGKFIFYLKQGLYADCEVCLEDMKQFRLFRDTPNYLFMRLMLSHLKNDTPLYFYEKDFKNSEVLFIQLKVIKSLEASRPNEALVHWKRLKEMDPDNYGENFKYLGQTNLMSLCLDKHKNKIHFIELKKPLSKNNVEALVELLSNTSTPIPKEILFQSLWGHEMLEPNDDEKLKNLIYYARKNKNLEIIFRNGCYFLASGKKPQSA